MSENLNEQFIDEKWRLESFVNLPNAQPGIKFGFIGVGQGGGKIVDAFASLRNPGTNAEYYPTLVINSNLGDMEKLFNVAAEDKLSLKGYERGVGKAPEVGKQAFIDNGADLFDAIHKRMNGTDMVVVVVSAGGGTGTGSLNEIVDKVSHYLSMPICVITTLPMPNEIEVTNALNALQELMPKLENVKEDEEGQKYLPLESLIIMDNQKIVEEHLNDPEVPNLTWDFYSNYKLASIFHEWSVLTSLGGDYTVDAADLQNHIFFGGNVITFAKKKINIENHKVEADLISEIVSTYKENNVLANGHDYKNDMKSMAMVIAMPRGQERRMNQDILEKIRRNIQSELPNVDFFPGAINYNNRKYAIVYTIASLKGLPERARNLKAEAEELKRSREQRQFGGFDLGNKIEVPSSKPQRRARSGAVNPFSEVNVTNESIETEKQSPEKTRFVNPYAKKKD